MTYREQYHADERPQRPYAEDLTRSYQGFCNLWRYMMAHLNTYGQPPHYRKTASFLASGGFASPRNWR